MGGSPKNWGQRITAAGSSGNPTVIQAVNTGLAILQPDAGVDMALLLIDANFVTIRGLGFAATNRAQIFIWGDDVVIDSNDFGVVTVDVGGDNLGHIYFKLAGETTVKRPHVVNNHFRGVYNAAGPSYTVNANALMGFSVEDAIVEYMKTF